MPWQTRAAEPTDYEAALADALDRVLGAGHHELAAIIAGLKADGVCAPDGKAWTPDSLQAVMRRLGA
ncbi:MAG: hypothetical protein FJX67_16790 [Alphaproteobacteria bacterium]|nr:hypothetical protein [Alphaproteobacteria bacterium]